jgi:hypothetical protein
MEKLLGSLLKGKLLVYISYQTMLEGLARENTVAYLKKKYFL